MTKNVKVVLNSAGVQELLKSDWAAGECKKLAERIRNAAGEGYAVEPRNYPERKGYAVVAESYEAKRECYEENRLLKVMGSV